MKHRFIVIKSNAKIYGKNESDFLTDLYDELVEINRRTTRRIMALYGEI